MLSAVSLVILNAILQFGCQTSNVDRSNSPSHWVGTWSTAPQLVEPNNNPPAPGLANNTLRQIVRVSIGGDTLRVRFSNKFSKSPVTFHAVHLALSKGGGAIDATTDRTLLFDGSPEVTIAPDTGVVSDPIAFAVEPRTDVAITIAYGDGPKDITGHPGSRTTSYILTGNQVSRGDCAGAITTDHWYNINTIDVRVPMSAAAIAILGNSITDGRGSVTNMQNRWPDVLSESLLKNSDTRQVAVLNMGIGGNCILSGGLGPTGLSRYERDILDQQGVRWVIVFEGVNDIGKVHSAEAAKATAGDLIAAYGQMIAKAHAHGLRIYGATILPFKGNGYYNPSSDSCRCTVNAWIRKEGNFDACIDFDKLMRSPQDSTKLGSGTYQNDGLHPDAAAYEKMGEAVDRALFQMEK